jgi:hypothetical protein
MAVNVILAELVDEADVEDSDLAFLPSAHGKHLR